MSAPLEIRYHRESRELTVSFDDGESYRLPAEFLRVYSPSAEVRGHGGPIAVVAGKEGVAITAVEPVGNYAVKLVFDDGHDTGLYTWRLLRELGRDRERLWQEHLARLNRHSR